MNRIGYALFLMSLLSFNFVLGEEVNEGSAKRLNIRFNPLILAVGGNVDLDIHITPDFTVGPSFFGWGGCSLRQTGDEAADGTQCSTWTSYGIRSNYFVDLGRPTHRAFIGPGLYRTTKKISHRFNQQTLKGDASGTAATAMVGYFYQSSGAFNVSGGAGGLYFLDKPSDIAVSNSAGAQTVVDTGSSTQFLAEFSLGFSF